MIQRLINWFRCRLVRRRADRLLLSYNSSGNVDLSSQQMQRHFKAIDQSMQVNERLEHVVELRFSVAPGCDQTQSTTHEFQWALFQIHGAVLTGDANQQALADARIQIEMGRAAKPIVDLPLNLITEGEHTLERRIQALEATLRQFRKALDDYAQDSEDQAVQAMARLGWGRGNADYRVLSVPGYAEGGTEVRCRVTAPDGTDFEPFEWQLTLRGLETRPAS